MNHGAPYIRYAAICLLCLLAVALLAHSHRVEAGAPQPVRILTVSLHGAVSPAMEELLAAALSQAVESSAEALLIELDTPGGLMESMRTMVRHIRNAAIPVLIWVGPSGAHAASAGVFLVAASTMAGMAPESTIGAASPVTMGGKDMDETMARKVMNDTLSLVRGMAVARNRNVAWYEDAVRNAVSITGPEAVLARVVEFLATSPEDFLTQCGARGIPMADGSLRRFAADGFVLERHSPGLRHAFLSWLLHPQVAYLLFLGGLAGLFFELATPGVVLPGVIGGLSLLLGLYAMSVLPTNVAGVLLIIFSVVLFLLEIKITSYGMLSVAAIISLFSGSMILFNDATGMHLPLATIIVTVLGLSLLLGAAVLVVGKAQAQRPVSGIDAMVGQTAVVRAWRDGIGEVLAHGEIWSASGPETLAVGDVVTIAAVHGLVLHVMPAPPAPDMHS
ncbi:MAG: nodulation protein NfeD [Desulfovibrionaceae bacterium]